MAASLSKTYRIVEGTSEPQDFQLEDDGEALVGTGFTVALKLYSNGTLVTTSAPTVAWLSQAAGTVRVSGCEGLSAGEYRVRFTLTDGSSKVGFVPGGPNVTEADRWIIVPAYA
jgi:hypothetical protein